MVEESRQHTYLGSYLPGKAVNLFRLHFLPSVSLNHCGRSPAAHLQVWRKTALADASFTPKLDRFFSLLIFFGHGHAQTLVPAQRSRISPKYK